MKYAFVLREDSPSGYLNWGHIRAETTVEGTEADLTARLRPWAMDTLVRENLNDGGYSAFLVELDEDGNYETYLAVASEDIVWFYGVEHVPVSS